MRTPRIEGGRRTKRVRTTEPDPGMARHPDLVRRDFTATAPNQLWVHWHNHERLHGYLGDIPPVEFEQPFYATNWNDQPLVDIQ